MYPYDEEQYIYKDALDLKHPETVPLAKQHNTKQTAINMVFDTVEDAAGFANALYSTEKEKVYINTPTFMNPRKIDDLFTDHSDKCFIM